MSGASEDPVEIFVEVLKRYLCDRGAMVLSMAGAAGQRYLKMALRGLWRRYEAGSTRFYWFMDVVDEIKRCRECLERLKEYGVLEFMEVEGEPYMLVDTEKLKELARQTRCGGDEE